MLVTRGLGRNTAYGSKGLVTSGLAYRVFYVAGKRVLVWYNGYLRELPQGMESQLPPLYLLGSGLLTEIAQPGQNPVVIENGMIREASDGEQLVV